MTGKKRTVVWPAMFFSGFKLQPEKIMNGKKVQSSCLTGRFFRRVQITTRKITTGKKRYSYLADGGSSDLAGTLWPENKRTVVWPAMFFSGFKLQPEKLRLEIKVQSSGQPFFPVIIFFGPYLIDEETRQKT
jgi:hypothetical protein